MLSLLKSFLAPNALTTLEGVLALVLADFIFGVLVSLRQGTFKFAKLPQFIQTSLLPYSGGLLLLALFSTTNTELETLFFTVAATVTAKFLADIVSKVGTLFAGVTIQSPIAVIKSDPEPQPEPVPEVTQ
jgi:hypothetical protein